ncbi:MAG: NAD(P)-dependent oxidoreductase, partial [Marmoricola sp.]
IGQQVGLLAEAFGMRVLFHDIVKKLPLGLARPVATLDALLEEADFVTLHVPETPRTVALIGQPQLARMRKGSYLLNLSRGNIVDTAPLREALGSGHLAGAALDVFPKEPTPTVTEFDVGFGDLPNVILTPHVGGSTQEAQEEIGFFVAGKLSKFLRAGSTELSVNLPEVAAPPLEHGARIALLHHNIPGVLASVNLLLAEHGANVQAQYLSTRGDQGYVVTDISTALPVGALDSVRDADHAIWLRTY